MTFDLVSIEWLGYLKNMTMIIWPQYSFVTRTMYLSATFNIFLINSGSNFLVSRYSLSWSRTLSQISTRHSGIDLYVLIWCSGWNVWLLFVVIYVTNCFRLFGSTVELYLKIFPKTWTYAAKFFFFSLVFCCEVLFQLSTRARY